MSYQMMKYKQRNLFLTSFNSFKETTDSRIRETMVLPEVASKLLSPYILFIY